MAFTFQHAAIAAISAPCVNCHTMHNSQDGTAMATYGADGQPWKGTGPYPALTRGDCLGCHGMGTSSNIVNIGGIDIPQVYHTGSTDLAAGNFMYVTTTDANGHNVVALGNQDDILSVPPNGSTHPQSVRNDNLGCAGSFGCHGTRNPNGASGVRALKGAHHNNVDGKCNSATENYTSYRFLRNVKGLENTIDRWQNKDENSHNEYFGVTSPMSRLIDCDNCHNLAFGANMRVEPKNNTISGFCGTCHTNFHMLEGIGSDTSSPFIRHPTDVVLSASGEYASYTRYSIEAPVARTTVPDSPSNLVQPGTDAVMCLSCHAAHATQYADILRWDYSDMIAGGGGSGGCFTCHTQKNQNP